MATRKTLQRQFLGPRYSPSSEAEIGVFNEAQSGMSALSQNLNQMTNFFFKEMQTRAVEEGEIYGATNPITMDELEQAAKTGEDVTGRLGYGLKGKAARSTAFASVISEIELEASRDYMAYIENAKLTQQDPQDVIDGLDSITLGYTSLLKKASPENYGIVKGALSKLSNGVLKGYINDIADIAKQQIQSSAVIEIESTKTNIPTYIESELSLDKTEQQMILDINKSLSVQKAKALFTAINKGKYTQAQTSQLIKDIDAEILSNKKSLIINKAIKRNNILDITSKILKGQKTNNPEINALLHKMSVEEKQDLVKKIRQAKKEENDAIEENERGKSEASDVQFLDLIVEANEHIDSNNKQDFEKVISKMKLIKPKSAEINKLILENNKFPNSRRQSDPEVRADIVDLLNRDILEYPDLFEAKDDLSITDFKEFIKELEGDRKILLQKVMKKLPGLEGYEPLLQKEISRQHPQFKASLIYSNIKNKVDYAEAEAKAKGEYFDVEKFAIDALTEATNEVNETLSKKQKTSLIRIYNDFKQAFIEFDKNDKNFNFTAQTDIQKFKQISDYLNAVDSDYKIKNKKVRQFREEVLPTLYNQITDYIKENPDE